MKMIEFDQVSKEELVTFISENFDRFDSERTPGFPENMLFDLESDSFQFFRNPNGFAIAFTGRPTEVELMFLYVRRSAEGQGIGTQLIDSVKHMAAGLPVTLKCEGSDREAYFRGRGFKAVMQVSKDRFCMQWLPANQSI
ncbi:GNAT family N-acetyltransferase [Pseudoduganella lutea]|uniref:N-acetyltransferase n=1 Tax=Pseudoduganella lutea TaxID=321985 RepID=A0A4P6L439_9BURK|nr:GNAT family N-acetyltransferase [Pseudoduganella lutea]QBE66350.1 N-acetyltransferase [Pseudoduganella lutea]